MSGSVYSWINNSLMIPLLQDVEAAASNGVQLEEIRPTDVTVEVPSETVAETPAETNTGCQRHTIGT